tara:strand:+ start:2588 stop:3640 length:1053 start_codon:yes stop_codon:yes gene_type:complete
MISHNKPNLPSKSIKDLTTCLKSKNLSTSTIVKKFEKYFCKKYYKSGFSVAVSSGTSALFLAIKALKIKKKKPRVLVPTYACSALLNAIHLAECEPIITDIDQETFTLNPDKIFKNIDIIILVNIFGSNPNIKKVKKNYPKSKIILDSCHSTGMKIENESDIFLSDVIIHSFYATKIITSGQGGLIWSRNYNYIAFCKDFINFDLRKKYIPRFNFLITDFQVSLLFDQLKNIEKIRQFRNNIFSKYKKSLPNKIKIFSPYNLNVDIVYRSVLIFDKISKKFAFKKRLLENKIESIIPVENFELLHNYKKLKKNTFKVSEDISKKTLSLPMHLSLKNNEINKICKLLKNFK